MGRLKYIFHCILHMDYKSLFDTVKTVHEVSGKNRIWLFFDIIKCGFKYGAGYKDYLLCAFYDLNDKQRATYVTRGINNSIVKSLNDPAYYHIFDNKSEFYTTFAEYLHREWLHFSKCTKEQFLDFMQDKDEIICKPDDASCGVGVEKLKKADYATLDAMYEDLKKKGADVIEEVVIQHPDMNRINPGSVNTIRVYTVLSDGVSNVVYACIRMGNSDRPVDNINAGGMYSPIDLETGKIACDKQRIVYERHPRSGCLLKGYQIPYWDKVMDICREAAHKVPQMPLQAPDKIGILPVFQKYIKGL